MRKAIITYVCVLWFLPLGCTDSTSPPEEKDELALVATYNINVAEPSGLVLDRSGDFLWVVSDAYRRIYKLSLVGETIKFISSSLGDLEGITQNNEDGTIYYVSEENRMIVQIDTSGTELESLLLTSLMHGAPNNGPEGITYKPGTNQFCIINENSPGILLYVNSIGEVDSTVRLSFANDYSGICMASEDEFWIVSDRSKTLSRVDASGKELFSFNLPFTGVEGVAYDSLSGILYLVNDPREVLCVYKIEQ